MNRIEEFRVAKSTWKLALMGALSLVAANVFADQITLYEHPALRGQSFTTTSALPNLAQSPFDDFASSVVVSDGIWEACTEPYFRGRCAQLGPGTYRRLSSELNGLVASVRLVGTEPQPPRVVNVVINPDSPPVAVNGVPMPVVVSAGAPVVISPASGSVVVAAQQPQVVLAPQQPQVVLAQPAVSAVQVPVAARLILYEHDTGGVVRAVELTSNVDNLNVRNFDNSADAALVSSGIWRLCDGEGARGLCTDFQPGQYPSLGALNGKVRSAYLIAAAPNQLAVVATVPVGRAVLYERANFGGPRAVVEYGPAPDLDWARFKGPASSVRIESGSWLVCSDLGYQGDCQVLEPGDYPVLTGSLSRGIVSARQVWRPEYGSLGPVAARDRHHPDLSRLVP